LAVWFARQLVQMPFAPHGDEGYLAYLGWRVTEGDVPYRDFGLYSYFPCLFYLLGGAMRLAPDPVTGLHLAFAPVLAAAALLLYRTALRLGARWAALLVTAAYILVPGYFFRAVVAPLSLLSIACGLWFLDGGGRPAAAGLGAAMGLGLVLRFDAAASALVTAAALFWMPPASRRLSRGWLVAALALGALLVLVPALVWLAWKGVLGDFVQQLLDIPGFVLHRTGSSHRVARPSLSDLLAGPGRRQIFAWIFWGTLALPFLLVPCLPGLLHGGKTLVGNEVRPRRATVLVFGLWLLTNLPQFAWERPDIAHVTDRAFAILLVVPLLAGYALRARREAVGAVRRAAATLVATASVLYPLCHALPIVTAAQWTMAPPRAARRLQLADGSSCLARQSDDWSELAQAVLARVGPGEPFANLPYYPGLNFVTGRKIATYHVFVAPHNVSSESAQVRYIADLEQSGARVAVYEEDYTLDEREDGTVRSFAPLIDRYVRTHFERVEGVPALWVRREE
jgi:hypothetical protein